MTRKTKADLELERLALINENTKLQERIAGQEVLIIRGRIEAFEFAATQFEVYASDNDEIHRRYRTSKKSELAVAAKRSQTFRDMATELRGYADLQKEDLKELVG